MPYKATSRTERAIRPPSYIGVARFCYGYDAVVTSACPHSSFLNVVLNVICIHPHCSITGKIISNVEVPTVQKSISARVVDFESDLFKMACLKPLIHAALKKMQGVEALIIPMEL